MLYIDQVLADQFSGNALIQFEALQLNEQTLFQVSGTDPGRVEGLHDAQSLVGLGMRHLKLLLNLFVAHAQIAVGIDISNHEVGDPVYFRRHFCEIQLPVEMILQSDGCRKKTLK